MRLRLAAAFAWIWFGLLVMLVATLNGLALFAPDRAPATLSEAISFAPGLAYAMLGALLVTRRPSNVIGLLLILTGTAYTVPIDQLMSVASEAPWARGPLWVSFVGLSSSYYLLYILPVLFLLLLFPTGRVPGPRWRRLARANLAFIALTLLLNVMSPTYQAFGSETRYLNPLGLYSQAQADLIEARWTPVIVPLFLGLLFILVILSIASLFVRYRRAGAVERAQIRWLLYAGALFATSFILATIVGTSERYVPVVSELFILGVMAIPVAVAIAILRHRLFDIDVIIRRTLQYGVLTGLLVGIYFGSILLLQTLLGSQATWTQSPAVVAVTTLAIAALFNPLRRRVQRFIDRRFYRSKIDAEQALARFAAQARDEVDLDQLRTALLNTVSETLQPERLGLWLRPRLGKGRGSS